MTTLTAKRQRMYLFERAYVVYAERIARYWRRLKSTVRGTWDFFWTGLGSRIIEIVLSILLLAADIYLCYLFVQYEQSHGRGFSWAMAGTLALIFGVAMVVLFAWKAPLHFVSRLVSGLTASTIILLLMLVALLIGLVIFSLYLVVLFIMTAFSFILFLPLRAGQELWLLYRKISYRCPYDDCPGNKLPIYICDCGTEYKDLLPSFYGIFHHTCQHSHDKKSSPTMDFLGRNKLPRLCSTCHRPLILSSIGELSDKPIAIIGGPNSGKTIFLLQAVRILQQKLSAWPKAEIRIDSLEQEQLLKGDLALLDRGQVVPKTAGDVQQAFGLAVKIPKVMHNLLYLYDAPGEHFSTISRFGQKQVIQHLKGIILLVDPFSTPGLSEYADRISTGTMPSPVAFWDIASVMISGVNQMLLRNPTETCKIPLAVLISKADAFPVEEFPFLRDLVPSERNPHSSELSMRCRQALEKLGEGRTLRALEQKFPHIEYFACSALGRTPDYRSVTPFRASGISEPFFWLLDIKEPAVGKASQRVMAPARAGTGD